MCQAYAEPSLGVGRSRPLLCALESRDKVFLLRWLWRMLTSLSFNVSPFSIYVLPLESQSHQLWKLSVAWVERVSPTRSCWSCTGTDPLPSIACLRGLMFWTPQSLKRWKEFLLNLRGFWWLTLQNSTTSVEPRGDWATEGVLRWSIAIASRDAKRPVLPELPLHQLSLSTGIHWFETPHLYLPWVKND